MRIRTIKPSFWRSDDITALPMDLRLLFIGLLSYVDDNGVGINDYRRIAADLFALEEDQSDVREFVRDGLATLSRGPLVACYMIEDRSYLFIVKWDDHQRVDRPNKARYPRPSGGFDPSTSRNGQPADQVAMVSRQPRESPSTGVVEVGRGEERKRGKEKTLSATASPPRDDVDQLCRRLHDRMIANGFKEPMITEAWRREARLLFDTDGRDLTQALRLVDWATNDEFWHPNIKSMGKFRAQYDTLLARARQEHQRRKGNTSPPPRTTDDKVADWQRLKTGTKGATIYALPAGESS